MRRRREPRGQGLVEFSLAIIIFLAVFVGIVDLARAVFTFNGVSEAAREITRATGAPEMREAWSKQGAVAMSMSPDEFARFMREDIDKWARIVKISGAQPDR